MLSPDELKRRIEAARILRGLNQNELGDLLAADGLGKHDVGRLERGTLAMRRVHRDALARHLGVPERWFTAESVDAIVAAEPETGSRLDAIERHLGRLEALLLSEEAAEALDASGLDVEESAAAAPASERRRRSRRSQDRAREGGAR